MLMKMGLLISRRLKGGLQLVRHKGRHAILVESTRLKAKDMSTSERERRDRHDEHDCLLQAGD